MKKEEVKKLPKDFFANIDLYEQKNKKKLIEKEKPLTFSRKALKGKAKVIISKGICEKY